MRDDTLQKYINKIRDLEKRVSELEKTDNESNDMLPQDDSECWFHTKEGKCIYEKSERDDHYEASDCPGIKKCPHLNILRDDDNSSEWIYRDRSSGHYCKKCGKTSPSTSNGRDMPTPYCPWCGRKMKESEVIYHSCC